MALTTLVLVLFTILSTAYLAVLKNASRRRLPPGPKGLPLVGNIKDLPPPGLLEAKHWLKHKAVYGPISSVTVLGQTLILIHDQKIACELLEKRSAVHSSRPRQVFAGELIGWQNAVGLSPYSAPRFRAHRKNMARIIGSRAAMARFESLQECEVGYFLLHVLQKPGQLADHIRRETGALVLRIAYGYTAERKGRDVLIEMAGDAMDAFAAAAVPGAFLVDMLPFLRYVPAWFPGAGFQKLAQRWGAELHDVTERPYAFVKHQMATGKAETSFLSQLIETSDETPFEKFVNKWSAMALYTAGADTTVAALSGFFLAMMAYPDVQAKAQEEIDKVIGGDRLPVAADRRCLPFVDAIVKEVLRWHPVAPMILPHTSTEDDVFEGYFIPKNAIIMVNVWHFSHDPDTYSDPMAFNPERFLSTNPEPDPGNFVFGFGRRICPGRLLADTSLFLNIAQSLAAFKISKPVDASGVLVEPELRWEPGVVSHPAPYKVEVRPRSEKHAALIKAVEEKYPWQDSDAEVLKAMKY